jgi:hypothetical protein
MSSGTTEKRFIKYSAGSTLYVSVAVDPKGSVALGGTLTESGAQKPKVAIKAGIAKFPCPQSTATYRLDIDMKWLAAGKVAIGCWLEVPGEAEPVQRPTMVFTGKKKAGDMATILVVTS